MPHRELIGVDDRALTVASVGRPTDAHQPCHRPIDVVEALTVLPVDERAEAKHGQRCLVAVDAARVEAETLGCAEVGRLPEPELDFVCDPGRVRQQSGTQAAVAVATSPWLLLLSLGGA